MALTQITGPYPIFTDLDGTPLDDGYLYIGEANEDPVTNPVQVFFDANLTIPATQPIRTNNGYAYRNGTPALIYTAGAFSITIRNKRDEFVLYSPVGYGFDPAAVSASVVQNDFTGDGVTVAFVLSSSPSTKLATSVFINGVYQEKDSYNISGNTLIFTIAPPLSSGIEVMTNETGVIGSTNATAVSYTAGYLGATAQTVQTKLEQYVSVKDFGAVGDGITNDTAAIQAAMDASDNVYIPEGTYKITTLRFKRNSQTLAGAGFGATSLVSTASAVGASVIANNDPAVTLLFCELRDMFVQALSLPTGFVVNWSHMQLGKIDRVWSQGGGNNCVGFAFGATWTVTECTYNTVIGCYTGSVLRGFQVSDGANNNVFINCRAQPAFAGGHGFWFSAVNPAASVSSCTIIGGAVEYPGQVSNGVYVGDRVDALTINGLRLESVGVGYDIQNTALNTTIIGPYYSSNGTNISNLSTTTTVVGQGGVTLGLGQDALNYYDEGSFTPLLGGTTTNGSTTYTIQDGRFTRIGNVCFVEGYVSWSATTATGGVQIAGLPFTVKNIANINPPVTVFPDSLTYSSTLSALATSNTTKITLYQISGAAPESLVSMNASGALGFSGTYIV